MRTLCHMSTVRAIYFPGKEKLRTIKTGVPEKLTMLPVDSNSAYLRLLMAGESNRINVGVGYVTGSDAGMKF